MIARAAAAPLVTGRTPWMTPRVTEPRTRVLVESRRTSGWLREDALRGDPTAFAPE